MRTIYTITIALLSIARSFDLIPSRYAHPLRLVHVPPNDPAEITFGRELGRGGFCTVFEVKKVALIGETLQPPPAQEEKDDDDSDDREYSRPDIRLQDRQFIATRYIRAGKGARYAVKTMIKNISEPTRFLGGVMDLAIETLFKIQAQN